MLKTSVARETFPETLEVMSHEYQLWRHIYTTNDVTAFPETFPTQLCLIVRLLKTHFFTSFLDFAKSTE